MSIVPASRLSSSDLSLLGNNIEPARRRRRRTQGALDRAANHDLLTAVQRSLASVGECISELFPPVAPAGADHGL